MPWTHSLTLHKGGLTHTDIRTLWWGYPTQRPPSKDPPRLSCFWRRRLFAFSLFFCRRVLSHCASMLLTLDHWTKIDSTAAAAAAAFQLFLFYPLFHSIPHSLYQFAFTFLHISSFANHCSPLKLLLVPLSPYRYTAHSFWHLCTLLFLLLLHHTTTSTVNSSCSFSLGLSSGQSTIRLAPPAAAARRRPDRFPCRMFHETFAFPREQVKSTCPSALRGLHSLVWSGHFRGGTSVTVRSKKIPAAGPHQTLCTITFGATLDPSYCCLRPRFALCTCELAFVGGPSARLTSFVTPRSAG